MRTGNCCSSRTSAAASGKLWAILRRQPCSTTWNERDALTSTDATKPEVAPEAPAAKKTSRAKIVLIHGEAGL